MKITKEIVLELLFQEYRATLNQRFTERIDVLPRDKDSNIPISWIDVISSVFEIFGIDSSDDDTFIKYYIQYIRMVLDKKFKSEEQVRSDINEYYEFLASEQKKSIVEKQIVN